MMEQLAKIWRDVLDGKGFEYGLPVDVSTHGSAIDNLIHTLHTSWRFFLWDGEFT